MTASVRWRAGRDVAASSSPDLVTVWSDADDGPRTALMVVDRRVRHLESQLYVNARRRAFLARVFGLDDHDDEDATARSSAARLRPGNDYFDERCRVSSIAVGECSARFQNSLENSRRPGNLYIPLYGLVDCLSVGLYVCVRVETM